MVTHTGLSRILENSVAANLVISGSSCIFGLGNDFVVRRWMVGVSMKTATTEVFSSDYVAKT